MCKSSDTGAFSFVRVVSSFSLITLVIFLKLSVRTGIFVVINGNGEIPPIEKI